MSVSLDYYIKGLRFQMQRFNDHHEPVISRARHIHSQVDINSCTILESRVLIDPATGRFYFTPGVSEVGSGDVVRP